MHLNLNKLEVNTFGAIARTRTAVMKEPIVFSAVKYKF